MIRIGIGGNILTPDELRAIGWCLIDAGNAQDHATKLREILQGLRA